MVRVLVTRPSPQAAEWAGQLAGHGIDAVALPLIAIAAPVDAAGSRAAWESLARRRLVMFVSPNAAARFFAARPPQVDWPAGTLAGSPGPGTTRTLVALGVPQASIVAPAGRAVQFDSEALWEQLRQIDWTDADVLLVRGEGGREWLAETLRGRGARVEALPTYRRVVPALGPDERRLFDTALQAPDAHLWLFSSSQAVANFSRLADAPTSGTATLDGAATLSRVPQRGVRWAGVRAIATHPRIAARARELGVGRVHESLPTMDALVACIQSLRT